ncbi:flagellar basal-body MS-ring/collar protein FliF [Tabrizicola sp. TH137]|uniref:flagellar basal-body MS-ring/collar protein FliF n=1 Tax=Tabrizicola sp. TH137 TaxID=2067452 RepID=UPI0020B423BF|nr:flagellar basal-body MS-ring/collar protein FliF [Tabrizicola sp. TH137]
MSFWSALDRRRQMAVIGASLAMFVSILMIGRMATTPSMALLYSGLDPVAAGEVVAALEARGVPHEVVGTAIHVPTSERDSLRLALAVEGLPATGVTGYELLDSLSGFGTTAQMFDAAWSRAVEGELVRTILANPQVRTARVHIARGTDLPFARDQMPSASVFVTTVGGLSAAQAQALRHLVAAAVTGLQPARVEVIDAQTGLIPSDEAGAVTAAPAARAEQIRRNVERLLEARVGPGRAVVEVAVDLVTESEQLSERRIDPQGRVAASTETETVSGSESRAGGDVTVASNLPDGDAAEGEGDRSQSEESRERVEYALSETLREVTRAPGDIRRIGVAVLVDGERVTAEDGSTTWQPRSEEELGALRELVASAAGIDEARGDVLTIKTLEFQPLDFGAEAPSSGPLLDLTRLAIVAALAAVALVALFVLRPALRQARAQRAEPASLPPLAPLEPMGPVLTGEIAGGFDLPPLPLLGGDGTGAEQTDPVERLRRLIDERKTESLEILRSWMDADGGRA